MNQKCKFPFLYKISQNETIEKNACSLSMPPSHAECDMLARAKNWTERVPRDMNKIIIRKDISKVADRALYPGVKSNYVMLDCYAEYFQSGWCGTCLKSARPGQPGYCGEDAEDAEDGKKDKKKDGKKKKKEQPRPSAWGGWGFCSQLCTQTNYQGFLWSNEPRLKEMLRRTSSHEDCSKHLDISLGEGQEMSRLCLLQEQELAEKAHFKMMRNYFQQRINNLIFCIKTTPTQS